MSKISAWNKGVIILIFSLVFSRIFFLHPTFSDENFYFNVAKNLVEGLLPYKDFFFAHPPLQILLLASLFKIFGAFFMTGKIFTLLTSSLCILMVYLISKNLYDEKTGFVAAVIFSIFPAFISFSLIGYGMWESLLFFLISFYLVLKNKVFKSSLFFVAAIFTRYIALLYLPFLLLTIHLKKGKISHFLKFFISISSPIFLSLLAIFKGFYFQQTFEYHLTSKLGVKDANPMQYWSIGFFTFFLAIFTIFISFREKDRKLLFLSLTALTTDLVILLFFNLFFYHYFLISLPLYAICTARSFNISRDFLIRFSLLTIVLLSLISNSKTIDFYLNPHHSKTFKIFESLIKNETEEDEKIFGEPVITNYLSFITGRKISGNFFDSYLSHIIFEGEEKVIEILNEEKPKIFIEANFGKEYYLSSQKFKDFVSRNYELVEKIENTQIYFVYRLKNK